MENTNTPTSVKSDNELQITIDDFKLIRSFYPEFTRSSSNSNKFYVGWSELMPVVEKIETIDLFEVRMQLTMVKVHCIDPFRMQNIHVETVHQPAGKLAATYKCIVEFIKYYNTTTNENGK